VGLTSSAAYPLTARAAMALYGLAFYLWRPWCAAALAIYEAAARSRLTSPRFLVPALFAAD